MKGRPQPYRCLRQRIEEDSIRMPYCGCWIWEFSRSGDGYPVLKIHCKTTSAHRTSYEIFKGPISPGMMVLHKCDTPMCVNPDHLFLGYHITNSRDRISKVRGAIGRIKSPYPWVTFSAGGSNKWVGKFHHQNILYDMGRFPTPEQAHEAVLKKRTEMGLPIYQQP